MRCGISTACFYPENTLAALQKVLATGTPVTEVFLGTFSELEDAFTTQLVATVQNGSTQVESVHPFSSAMEGFFFASRYAGRFADGLALYRRYFALCQKLGADKLIFHGDYAANSALFPLEAYAENFCTIAQAGREYGVTLCHENVAYCRLGSPDTMRAIRPMLGDYAAFALDLKQTHRFGVSLAEMIDAMGGYIRHVHISDVANSNDCVPPGQGDNDFAALIGMLQQAGYAGDLMIELYREGFGEPEELVAAMRHIHSLLPKEGP